MWRINNEKSPMWGERSDVDKESIDVWDQREVF